MPGGSAAFRSVSVPSEKLKAMTGGYNGASKK